MKHIHSLLCLAAATLFTSSQLWAAESLVVSDASGQATTFLLSSHPDVYFHDQYIELRTDDQKVFYPIDQYRSFAYGKNETSIDEVETKGEVFSFNGGLQARGLKSGEDIFVYDMNGRIVVQGKADGDGRAELFFDTGRINVFLVKTTSNSFKVVSGRNAK